MVNTIIVARDSERVPPDISRELLQRLSLDIKEVSTAGGDRYDTFDFVGLAMTNSGELLVVLPKHCTKSANPENDARMIFTLLNELKRESAAHNMGPSYDTIRSDFPFAAFYKIYDFFDQYGLYLEGNQEIRNSPPGKINWKITISKSNNFLLNKTLFMFPIYYQNRRQTWTFISECMACAIDYTINHFGMLLDLPDTGFTSEEECEDLIHSRKEVVAKLEEIRSSIFQDSLLSLIDSLLEFYEAVRQSHGFILRDSQFNYAWEILVHHYLANHFAGFEPRTREILIEDNPRFAPLERQVSFSGFNRAYPEMSIILDNYAFDRNTGTQYIIDEKYYSSMSEFNYKQFAYTVLLHGHSQHGIKAKTTYSAMILPYETNSFRLHYIPDTLYSPALKQLDGIIITEQYLNIKKVIEDYLAD